MSHIFYTDGNDNVLRLDNLKYWDPTTGKNIYATGSATVTATMRTGESTTSTAVSGLTFPITATYVSGSNGRFSFVFDKALALVADTVYWAHVTIAQGTNDGHLKVRIMAKSRKV